MRKTGMDNDPKHLNAAYEAARYSKEKKLQARVRKMEFALIAISEVPQIPPWVRDLAREALK